MIVHLSDYTITYDRDQDHDTLILHYDQRIITYLTKDKWFIVLATEDLEATYYYLTDSHFDSINHTFIKLYDDTYIFIVPLGSLMVPSFVIYNTNYCE